MTAEDDNEEGFVKCGRVLVGVTPSVHSGRPSEMIKSGEAIAKDEEDKPVVAGHIVALIEEE